MGHLPLISKKRQEMEKRSLSNSFILLFEELRRELGTETFVFFLLFRNTIFTVSNPIISRVFSDHKTFMKASPKVSELMYVNGTRILGKKGLLTESGTEVWYHKRKMMDPAFKKTFLKSIMGDMKNSADKLCHLLEQKNSQKSLDIYSILTRVALEIVCTCGFSLNDDFIMLEQSALNEAVDTMLEVVCLAFPESPTGFSFKLPWKFREEKARLKEASALLRGAMRKLLAERMDKNNKEPNLTSNDILAYIIKGIHSIF